MRLTGIANSRLLLSFPVAAGTLPAAAGVYMLGALTSPDQEFVLRSVLPGDLARTWWSASSHDLLFQMGNVADTGCVTCYSMIRPSHVTEL